MYVSLFSVLRRFLEAATLYPDAAFRARFEARARENMGRELAGSGDQAS